jgi:hypothetical protein
VRANWRQAAGGRRQAAAFGVGLVGVLAAASSPRQERAAVGGFGA